MNLHSQPMHTFVCDACPPRCIVSHTSRLSINENECEPRCRPVREVQGRAYILYFQDVYMHML